MKCSCPNPTWRLLRAALICMICTGCLSDESKPEEAGTYDGPFLGEPCDETTGCETGNICIYGECRTWCTTIAPGRCKSQTCLDGGCRTADENQCGADDPCLAPGLTCAIDKSCRPACATAQDCLTPNSECIVGACVNAGEPGIDPKFFECETGTRSCDGNLLVGCNTVRPGYFEEAVCASPDACQQALDSGGTCD